MLLNIDSATVFHPSHSAPALCTRGQSSTYFGRLEIDNPAVANGTAIHHRTPRHPANAVTKSNQYSGVRNARRNVIGFSASSGSSITHPALHLSRYARPDIPPP